MWIERVVTIMTIGGFIAGGFMYLDENYASAADLKRLEQNLKRDRLEDRARELSNRIFELEFKQRSSPQQFKPIDAALLQRYKDELRDVQRRARDVDR